MKIHALSVVLAFTLVASAWAGPRHPLEPNGPSFAEVGGAPADTLNELYARAKNEVVRLGWVLEDLSTLSVYRNFSSSRSDVLYKRIEKNLASSARVFLTDLLERIQGDNGGDAALALQFLRDLSDNPSLREPPQVAADIRPKNWNSYVRIDACALGGDCDKIEPVDVRMMCDSNQETNLELLTSHYSTKFSVAQSVLASIEMRAAKEKISLDLSQANATGGNCPILLVLSNVYAGKKQ